MGLEQNPCFSAVCDKCNNQFDNGNFTIFSSVDRIKEELADSDWVTQKGKLLCYDCWDGNDSTCKIWDLKPIITLKN